ncbi:hypothetical protein LTS10_011235 [Elasticomyces elasticus]|nr:hypothetical protein LTS10_011235 [Elasticomyces elasticus]
MPFQAAVHSNTLSSTAAGARNACFDSLPLELKDEVVVFTWAGDELAADDTKKLTKTRLDLRLVSRQLAEAVDTCVKREGAVVVKELDLCRFTEDKVLLLEELDMHDVSIASWAPRLSLKLTGCFFTRLVFTDGYH